SPPAQTTHPAPGQSPRAPADAPVSLGDVTLSPALYRMYLEEVRGHLATLKQERDILARLQTPPSHQSIRAAHTFASTSATVGIKPPHALAHALEMALVRIGAAEVTLTPAQLQLFDETLHALDGMLTALGAAKMPEAEPELAGRLADLRPEVAQTTPVPTDEPFVEPTTEAVAEEPAIDFAPSMEQPAPVAEPSATAETSEGQQSANRRQQRIQDDLDPQLVPLFLEEADELMAQVGPDLRAWRAQPGDAAIAGRLQRIFHTLKGSARMAGAMGIGELIHSMETRVDNAVAAHAVSPQLIDDLEASFDRAQFLVDKIRGGGEEAPAEAPAPEAPTPTAPTASVAIPATPAAPLLAVDIAAEKGAEPEGQAARAVLRVQADLMDRLVNEAGELAIARSRIEGEMRSLKTSLLDLTENVMRLRGQLREIEIQAESQMQSRQAEAAEKNRAFDPLEMDRFTRFQELTRMMAESVNDVTTVQHNLLRNLDHADAALAAQARLNRELSQALMGVRMVPFNTLAERLHRIVRQTAKETDRRANLDIRGGQTELDRSVLEKITGPLEHLLRNAVSHGIETVSARGDIGKDPMGQITLALAQEGNEVRIELQDDGAGLDLVKIRDRAESRGLLTPEQEVDEAQLVQFIFMPGFSTADKLTEISGRGVGMDVVKTETAALGGRIEVHSTPGKGSSFRIYLPLTLAVTQAVLVKSGNRTYAIPSTMVEQVSEMKPDAVQRIRDEGGTEWLGTHYVYHYLPRLLGEPDAQPQALRRHWVMLLKSGAGRIAVEVDALTGNQEIVVKNIGPQLARVVGIAGATVLGDGQVALILNPIALAGREHIVDVAAGAVAETEVPTTVPTVLVVDDSLTVRKITGRLLAREGYHVVTAKDGVDALEQLIDLRPAVILSDIEMPRMDGFDLVRNIRADAGLKDIPVIMITSRIAEKHKQYAKEIGADHYLGKPYDEEELLGLIAGYTKK
ncbi:hybrid sensor histidine kinase/response regulator, partial [bacterium]|nr:hybrid sensor histidine kinase/response regulator [bacterium]